MATPHRYELTVRWTGNSGNGTATYRSFARTHEVRGAGKPTIPASADPAFRGEAERWNPEELLLASLSQCHMLWYLHLCSANGVVVSDYVDEPVGTMELDAGGGGGQFTEAVLRPQVTVVGGSHGKDGDVAARGRPGEVFHRPLGRFSRTTRTGGSYGTPQGMRRTAEHREQSKRPVRTHGARGSGPRRCCRVHKTPRRSAP